MKYYFFLALISLSFFSSCGKDDDQTITEEATEFKVTIENVFEGKDYFDSGATGLITPGMSESFSFNAGKGHYLQFATMFVQSNDLFFAPDDEGIVLYDENGLALTGDITSKLELWDAGTEVNEEPGVGPNQAPRQAGPNTGADENGTVELIANIADGFTYPAIADEIEVTITHDGGTLFTVTLNNISDGSSLPSPLAPGAWVIHSSGQKPLFTEGSASSTGLEGIAEDGNNTETTESLAAASGLVSPFAPGAYSVGADNAIFASGSLSTTALEGLAEDGNVSGYTNVFNTPDNASDAGPIFPSDSYSFTFTAEKDDNLSFATMLIQTNDWFIGLNNFSLYNSNGSAISGDITDQVRLYDAGTELDEYPGAGANQAPRQSGADTGVEESKNVGSVANPDSNVPEISNMVKITIEAI